MEETFFVTALKNYWELIKMIMVSKVVIIYFMFKAMPAVLHDCAVSSLMLANKQLFLIFFWLALRNTRQSLVFLPGYYNCF